MAKYRMITGRTYKCGIWDNCSEAIESNGRRIRCSWHYVRWSDNTGTLARRVVYMDRHVGRRVLRAYRRNQANALRGDYDGMLYWLSDICLSQG